MTIFRRVLHAVMGRLPHDLRTEKGAMIRDSEQLVADERAQHGRAAARWLQFRIVVDVLRTALAAVCSPAIYLAWAGSVGREFRFSLRRLRRSAGSTWISVLVCAITIGATVAIGGVLSAAFLDSGGTSSATRVVALQWTAPDRPVSSEFSYPDYVRVAESGLFTDVSGSAYTTASCSCVPDGQVVSIGLVSDRFFSVLGVSPLVGLAPVDRDADGVLISYSTWRTAFLGSSEVLGQRIAINGEMFTVAGVAPKSFVGPVFGVEPAVWLPLSSQPRVFMLPAYLRKVIPDLRQTRGYSWIRLWALLPTGSSVAGIEDRFGKALPNLAGPGYAIQIVAFRDARVPPELRGVTTRFLTGMSCAIVLVVGLAAAALMQSSVLRAEQALPEMALRVSIGAPLGLALLLPIVDTAAIVAVGGVLGLAAAPILLHAFLLTLPPTTTAVNVSVAVLTWRTGLLALALLLALAILPATVACLRFYRRRDRLGAFLQSRQRPSANGIRRAGGFAVLLQVSAAAALLGMTLVLGQIIAATNSADLGFQASRLVIVDFDLTHKNLSDAEGNALMSRIRSALQSVPSVAGLALATQAPLNALARHTVLDIDPRASSIVQVYTNVVDSNFFAVLGTPVLTGVPRLPTGDGEAQVINERYAQLLSRQAHDDPKRSPQPVIGVVGNVRYQSLFGDVAPMTYASWNGRFEPRLTALLRLRDDSPASLAVIRDALGTVSPDLRNSVVRRMQDNIAVAAWIPHALGRVIGIFALISLAVSVTGTFSVVAFLGQCRRREFAIRTALGATSGGVLRASMRAVAFAIPVGCLVGWAISYQMTPTIENSVGQVIRGSAWTSMSGAIICSMVALGAAVIGAAPSSRADVAAVLRAE